MDSEIHEFTLLEICNVIILDINVKEGLVVLKHTRVYRNHCNLVKYISKTVGNQQNSISISFLRRSKQYNEYA